MLLDPETGENRFEIGFKSLKMWGFYQIAKRFFDFLPPFHPQCSVCLSLPTSSSRSTLACNPLQMELSLCISNISTRSSLHLFPHPICDLLTHPGTFLTLLIPTYPARSDPSTSMAIPVFRSQVQKILLFTFVLLIICHAMPLSQRALPTWRPRLPGPCPAICTGEEQCPKIACEGTNLKYPSI